MTRHSPFPAIPASELTPEPVYMARRRLVTAMTAGAALTLTGCRDPDAGSQVPAPAATQPMPIATGSDPFRSDETQTTYADATSYNNYYEFGTGKADPARRAYSLQTSPWMVQISGHADVTGPIALEDLLRPHAQQERIYRLRCVEGWSMVIPWQGIALGDVLRRFRPTSRAKYVAFTTLADPAQMPGIRYPVLDWPYVEGLRMDEAMHPLTLLATGMYGRAIANQNGAPLRLVVPWKYGFKSIKSIVRISFEEQQPATSWNLSQPAEYGFYSNVNPDVDHPRWSQRTERRLTGTRSRVFANRIPTRLFNGYAEQVAGLYAGMDLRRNF